MQNSRKHAYTQALIDAWQRFSADAPEDGGPVTEDFPGLVDNLFVLACGSAEALTFRNIGTGVERLFGRDLVEHDFLSLWTSSDRAVVAAAAQCTVTEHGPTVINATASRLAGGAVDIEFTLAPIRNSRGEISRLLGLCQVLTPQQDPSARPIGAMRLEAVFPPAAKPKKPALRLVVSND